MPQNAEAFVGAGEVEGLSDREHDKHVSQIGLIAEPSERAQRPRPGNVLSEPVYSGALTTHRIKRR
jgi:hypothetical protein